MPISMSILLKGQLSFMNCFFEVIGIASYNEKHFNDVMNREGIRMVSIEIQRKISPYKDLVSLWKLYVFFRKEKPDIVHSITPKAGLLSMVAAFFAGVPIRMHTFTGLIFPSRQGVLQQLLIFMDRILCYTATNVYPEGKGVKQDLDRYRITSKEMKIIANGNVNGINGDYFTPDFVQNKDEFNNNFKIELGIQPDDIVFSFVGRISIEKGIVELLNVFEELATQNKIKLILIGSYEKNNLSKEIIQRIENNNSVFFLGRFDDIRPYYSISDIFVLPSYREGFPNSVLEAGAMGVTCIVTDINGCNEIIINGYNGLIIRPKDRISLRKAMLLLVEDEVLRNQLANNSRPHILKYYNRDEVWKVLKSEYELLLSKVK